MQTSFDRPTTVHSRRRRRDVAAIGWWLAGALLCLLWITPVLAQGTGGVLIDDPDELFDNRAAVQAAAERLAAEGADVVVIGVRDAGIGSEAPPNYLDRRLRELGVASGLRALRGNEIIFFVALQPRHAAIHFVAAYSDKLQRQVDNLPVYQQIINRQMAPHFAQNDFGSGMVAAIDAVRTTLNPPPSPAAWIGPGAIAVGGAGFLAAGAFRRRRAAAEALGAARKRMEEARSAAGGAIADLGQRVETAQEKAQYDKVSYSPSDVERIGQRQRSGEVLFVKAQETFDAAEEATIALARPTAADYESLAAKFAEAQRLTSQAAEPIEEAERMRAALDSGPTPSTGATTRIR